MIVFCVKCRKPVYDCTVIGEGFAGDSVQAKDFVPLSDDVQQPQAGEQMTCPYCGEIFAATSLKGGICLLLEGDAWWPHPPIKTS